ncbi:MAG: serine/threonine protein kinase [Hyalangium sp.]|uniref:serine/threonine protein kinase n=1 Tax=Hyalangium sp. TaxID=2028555 RepID=UPI003899C719
MGTQRTLREVDPLCLPVGLRIGAWRVMGWRGRGGYGTLYRVEQVGREEAGPFALKLAIYPGDERFAREAWLLSRIVSPHVPRLHAQGVWEHPSGAYPYLVMDWVEGETLYEWADRRNPSSREVLRLLAQGARALAATHAAGGVHRDVKGDNVLVRPDGRVFLTDFGAGHYRGAATLTSKLWPPGTQAYRSPEAWAFLSAFRRHPTVHYPASACDDLFALGVTAYRLVMDEYPPSTRPEDTGSEVWREGGPGPRPPRELNPRITPELDALILRLLSPAPIERFEGRAREAAKALEQAAQGAGAEGDVPLFSVGDEHGPRWRSPGALRLAAERDAVARQEFALREAGEGTRAVPESSQFRSQSFTSVWGVEVAMAFLGLLLAGLTVACLYRRPEVAQVTSDKDSREHGFVAVGDSASTTPASTLAPMSKDSRVPAVGLPLEKPFPGQRTPPCTRYGEVELRGGCWYRLGDAPAPCREDAYEWKNACYLPSFPTRRQTTSHPE